MAQKMKRNIPEISSVSIKNNIMTFNLNNINLSFVNSLRRTILSDIPMVVCRTSPYEKNDCIIHENTTRLNNEILKQRLSCIPIHIQELEDIENLQLEVEKENTSDTFMYITTKDFKIKDTSSNKYLAPSEIKKIFPPDKKTGDYILFARLRPKISKDFPGEKLSLKCKLSTSNAKENGSFNAVSTCAYSFEDDVQKQNSEWEKYSKSFTNKSKMEINRAKKNWFNHTAKKFYKKDSFNFILETIGVYSNIDIIKKACGIINNKLDTIKKSLNNNRSLITESESTINSCFDITLQNEDYSIGKLIEFILYKDYYKNGNELSYVGFIKKHPHYSNSIIRLAFNDPDDGDVEKIKSILNYSIDQCKNIISHVDSSFG